MIPFTSRYWGLSLLDRFKDMNPGRRIVSDGDAIQDEVAWDAENIKDDPVFGVGGELAFNWGYANNGHRIVLTGGHLSDLGVNDDNTHGLGNDFHCNPLIGSTAGGGIWQHEISNIQDCPVPYCTNVRVQGTDHGSGSHLKTGPVYGNYAIYISKNVNRFPPVGTELCHVVRGTRSVN